MNLVLTGIHWDIENGVKVKISSSDTDSDDHHDDVELCCFGKLFHPVND